MKRKFYYKDWIMFEEVGNEGGILPADLKEMKVNEGNPDENKHVPFIKEVSDGYIVSCGKTGYHDENPDHHQIFIELNVDNYTHRYYVQSGDKPEVHFKVAKGNKVSSNAFCNKHGLWSYQFKK